MLQPTIPVEKARTDPAERKLPGPPPAIACGDLNLLRCLVGRGIPLVVVASDAREPTLRSRYCVRSHLIHSPQDPDRALADLEELGHGWRHRPVLYYGTDAMLLLVSRNRDRLKQSFRFTMPSAELIEALVDKARFYALARRAEIPVPQSAGSDELSGPEELLASIPLPYAFKPSVHIGWMRDRAEHDGVPQKALRARTPEEARQLYEELSRFGPFVVQRWIPGGEDSIYSFHCYADERSQVLGWFVGKKIRTYPKEAGVSTYLELCRDPAVAQLGFEIVERLGFSGPLKIDIKRDPTSGELFVLELNPRFSLWCYLGAVSGVNLPQIAYAHLVGEHLPPPKDYVTGVRWLSFGNDFRSFVRSYRPSGELTLTEYLKSFAGRKVYDVFSWRDPLPWMYSTLSYAEAAGKRVGQKVLGRLALQVPP